MIRPLIFAFALSVFLGGFALVRSTSTQEERKPSMIVLLADDLGWNGVEHYGSDLHETSNINRLAEQGMTFTNESRANTLKSRLHQRIEQDRVQMPSENPDYNPNKNLRGK